MEDNLVPRRNITSEQKPSEWAIVNSISEVEKLGADVELTNAVSLLQQAMNKVSDYIDNLEG